MCPSFSSSFMLTGWLWVGVTVGVCSGATVEQFEQAKGKLSALRNDPGNEVKLKIYALFKQVGAVPAVPAV